MQPAFDPSIVVHVITPDDDAELCDIQMRVFGFQGIERPFDATDPMLPRVFALRQFQLGRDARIPMIGRDGHDLGIPVWSPVPDCRHRAQVTRRRGYPRPRRGSARRWSSGRHRIEQETDPRRGAEDLPLQLDALLEFGGLGERADQHRSGERNTRGAKCTRRTRPFVLLVPLMFLSLIVAILPSAITIPFRQVMLCPGSCPAARVRFP